MKIKALDIVKIIIGILAFMALIQLKSLILSILVAVIVASFIEPLILFFKRIGANRGFAVVLSYLLLVAIFLAFFFFALPPLFKESLTALNSLPDSIKTSDVLNPIQKGLYKTAKGIFPEIPSTISLEDLTSLIASYFSDFAGGIFDTFNRFFDSIVSFILVLVLSIYLSVEEKGVAKFLRLITPKEYEKYVVDLWTRVQKKIGLWMQGQIILMGIVFLVVLVSLSVLKIFLGDQIQNILLIALIAGFMELIPVLGTFVSTIVAFLLSSISGGFGVALIVLIVFTLIHQIESHVIYPAVIKKIIGVPPMLVIISLIAGIELAGFVGIILSIPISVLIVEFIDDRARREALEEESA
ncbi:AI-2E family transporter [Candidatus Parcubacteria bacterium]|nr:AI-2E family transporter [Candidatus Parcubacteria bacterium]